MRYLYIFLSHLCKITYQNAIRSKITTSLPILQLFFNLFCIY